MDGTRDVWHRLLKALDHNRYTVIGIVGAIVAAITLTACQSTTPGVLSREPVTRAVFEREVIDALAEVAAQDAALATAEAELSASIEVRNARVEALNAQIDSGRAELARKDEFKAQLVRAIGGVALSAVTGRPIDTTALVTTALQLGTAGLAAGALIDNRRKDRVIAARPRASGGGK